jgi:hypothetical protein
MALESSIGSLTNLEAQIKERIVAANNIKNVFESSKTKIDALVQSLNKELNKETKAYQEMVEVMNAYVAETARELATLVERSDTNGVSLEEMRKLL